MQDPQLKMSCSFYGTESPKDLFQLESSWKSDIELAQNKHLSNAEYSKSGLSFPQNSINKFKKYYKRYDHDEIPVKEFINLDANFVKDLETGDNDRVSLTNSELERIEKKVYSNISQELQTDESSTSTLESNIKLFKITVQEIFDNFKTNMRDFELYKKKFHEILAKNQTEQITEMEDFIKDMIHHIVSSESSLSNKNFKLETEHKQTNSNNGSGEISLDSIENGRVLESPHSIVEAFKNENYLTDSTLDENNSKVKSCNKKEENFNIYLLSGIPFVQIKMNDRNLLSEINIKHPNGQERSEYHVASAENMKKVGAKKIELEKYVKLQQDLPEREIPVKVSFAKKNIHLDEDFTCSKNMEHNKSFMAKICSYICKRFRKNTFV